MKQLNAQHTDELAIATAHSWNAVADGEHSQLSILLIESDSETAAYVVNGLTQAGHNVNAMEDGHAGLTHWLNNKYDLIVVGSAQTETDGLSIIKVARGAGVQTPVLFLTDRTLDDDPKSWFEAGVDDYVVKPFAFTELLARANAVVSSFAASEDIFSISVGDLTINYLDHTARRGEVDLALHTGEYKLLEVLMRNAGRVVSPSMLLEAVWDFHFEPQSSVVDTHIRRLRNKIDEPFDTPLIHTVGELGYSVFVPE